MTQRNLNQFCIQSKLKFLQITLDVVHEQQHPAFQCRDFSGNSMGNQHSPSSCLACLYETSDNEMGLVNLSKSSIRKT